MAPQTAKKPCSNNEKYKYTGKELSPLGIGVAAEAESIGKQMIGRDGKNWIVVSKNNNKVWMRAPEPNLVKEHPILPKSSDDEDNRLTSTYDKGGPSGTVHGDTDKSDVSSSDEDEEESMKLAIPKLNVNTVEENDDEETTPRPTDSPHSIAGSPKAMKEKPKRISMYSSEMTHQENPTSAIDMIDTESDEEESVPNTKEVSDSEEEEEAPKPKSKSKSKPKELSESEEEEEAPKPKSNPKSKSKPKEVSESEEEEAPKPKSKSKSKSKPKELSESEEEEAPKPKSKSKSKPKELSESEEEEAPKPKSKPKSKSKPKELSESEEEEAPKPPSKAQSKSKTEVEKKEVTVVSKRKTHAVKASMYEDGYTKVEDGITYVVKESANNVKKWIKQPQPKSRSSSTGKKRGPTAYNLFIGKQLTELRETVPGLKTTEYMKLALQTWNNMTPEEKADIKK